MSPSSRIPVSTKQASNGIQSISRAALLLRTLATFGSRGASLTQVTALSNLPKATTFRLLTALVDERLVERPRRTRLYRLGPEILSFGISTYNANNLKDISFGSLERISKNWGITAYLGIRNGYDMLCLLKVESECEKLNLIMDVNDRWPLGIGSFSLALLAFLKESEISEIVEFNRRRMAGLDTLTFEYIERSINKTRRNGYAKRVMRSNRGLAGVSVPVFDPLNRPIASICVVSKSERLKNGFLREIIKAMKEESSLIGSTYEDQLLQYQQKETWRLAVRSSYAHRIPE